MTKQIYIFGGIAVAVLVLVGIVYFADSDTDKSPGELDQFAQCLGPKGATFYGAFWCPHCVNQKALFGASKEFLPYVECSTPDRNGQLQVCKDKGINGYPTWEFAGGERVSGEVSLETLAEKTGCVLPSAAPEEALSTEEEAPVEESSATR